MALPLAWVWARALVISKDVSAIGDRFCSRGFTAIVAARQTFLFKVPGAQASEIHVAADMINKVHKMMKSYSYNLDSMTAA